MRKTMKSRKEITKQIVAPKRVNELGVKTTAYGVIGILLILGILNIPNLISIGKELAEKKEYRPAFIRAEVNVSYTEDFLGKYSFINLNGLTAKLLGRRTVNDVVKLGNGHLTSPINRIDTTAAAMKVADLNEWLGEKGIPFLFVQTPYKIDENNKQLPRGIEDFSNENADAFLNAAKQSGVSCVDMRKELTAQGLSYEEMFYKTDHHWTTETAFTAFTVLADYMREEWGYEIADEITDRDSYEEMLYSQCLLGSHGRRCGKYYGGLDDFKVIYPKFSTNISTYIADNGEERSGSFRASLLKEERLLEENVFEASPYHTYIGDEYGLVIHRNEEASVKEKVMIVRDSYVLPMQAFLSETIAQLYVVDLRYYEEMSLYEYIEEVNPDKVIIIYNPYMYQEEKAFVFGEKK